MISEINFCEPNEMTRRPCLLISRFRTDSVGRAERAQPGAGRPLSIPAGETSLTQTILKRINFSLVMVPQRGSCSFLCWHKARSGSGRETNRWLDGKWDGSFQRQSWLVPAYGTHTAWAGRGSCCLAEGFFACSHQSPTLTFWDVFSFRNLPRGRKVPSFILKASFLGALNSSGV